MRGSNWYLLFVLSAIVGVVAGYLITLLVRSGLIPPAFRLSGLREPANILLLGTDVVYDRSRGRLRAHRAIFVGRADTIMVARVDPLRNSIFVISIPRDTQVEIPGRGIGKINSANALGGPELTTRAVSSFLGIPIHHYLVLNTAGLVEMVDRLGGINIQVPKRMRYKDRAGGLLIDLEPGARRLNGQEAMGFVRFRHDALGDIGRVQRQEIFIKALLQKAMQPESWPQLSELVKLARRYVDTDLSDTELLSLASFIRAVPPENQKLAMLPGQFSGSGDWLVSRAEVEEIVSRLTGRRYSRVERSTVSVSIENASSDPSLGQRLAVYLRRSGYPVMSVRSRSGRVRVKQQRTSIVAQRGNPEEAELVKADLDNRGEIVNLSVGDIRSSITLVAGDDLTALLDREQSIRRQR